MRPQTRKYEILDCTIRDGGYLHNWSFSEKLVRDVYHNLSRAGVDVIEIGFRNIRTEGQGIWCSTPEELLNRMFGETSGAPIALLVDLGNADLDSIPDGGASLVKIYRVACHKHRVPDAIRLCEEIRSRGYKVSLQLMGIASYSTAELIDIIEPIAASTIDYVYFADSYGSLFPSEIKKYIDALKPTGKKIGFHAHNNLQLAFANSLEAIRNDIDIVDATIYGMGRGAGNLPTEVLIHYLEKHGGHDRYNSVPILDLINRYFRSLRNDLGWGYTLPYMLSGTLGVHPNYATHLLKTGQFTIDEMSRVLELVKELDPVGFDAQLLEKVVRNGHLVPRQQQKDERHDEGEVQAVLDRHPLTYRDRHRGRDFIVLANGKTLRTRCEAIQRFIKDFAPIVMGANFLGGLFKPDYHAFSNQQRFVDYVGQVDGDSRLLVSTVFDEHLIRDCTTREVERIVHLNRTSNRFDIVNGVITTNCKTISILLVAVAIVMGAKRVFIAGMDGYRNRDDYMSDNFHFYDESDQTGVFRALLEIHDANEALLTSINEYLIERNREELRIITPTSHKHFYSGAFS